MNVQIILFVAAICGSSVFAAPQQSPKPEPQGMEKTVATGVNSFGVQMLKNLHKSGSNDNILMSPLCIYEALSLVHLGSAGTTRNELATVMGVPQEESKVTEIHESLKSITKAIQFKPANEYEVVSEVSLATGLFVQNDFPIKQDFVSKASSYYESKVSNLDFAKNAAGATDAINQWASEKTKGRIPKLYSTPLDAATVMVLASSLYFNGRWKERFPAYKTKPEKFNTGVKEIEVQMMNDQKNVPYVKDEQMQYEAISLELDGGYSMVFILPFESQTIHNLTEHLDLHGLRSLKVEGIDYKVPRMKFSWSKSIKETLKQAGVSELFNKADLRNIASSGPISVSDVDHAAEMDVDEAGVKASAITSVQVQLYSLPVPPQNPKPFIVNRPYMVLLAHRPTWTNLFMSIVHEPTK